MPSDLEFLGWYEWKVGAEPNELLVLYHGGLGMAATIAFVREDRNSVTVELATSERTYKLAAVTRAARVRLAEDVGRRYVFGADPLAARRFSRPDFDPFVHPALEIHDVAVEMRPAPAAGG